jgi:hypothetical protein
METKENFILLTDEWHNKLGGKKDGFGQYIYIINSTKIIFTSDYVFIRQSKNDCPMNDDLCTIWNKDLRRREMYVHEWKELYYILKGSHLTIKEQLK